MSTLTATGKRIAFEIDREGPEQYRDVASRTVASLSERLTVAGAVIVPAAQDPGLLLRFSPGALPSWGVAAVYSWQDWENHRPLCAGLTAELAAAFGMPDLGARMSLAGGRQSGVPAIEVAIGRPAPGAADPLLDPAFPDQAAEAICQGLCSFWVAPAPPEPEPLPETVAAEPEAVEEAPAADACHCEADSMPDAGIEVVRIVLDPVTITSRDPDEAPPPPPADPVAQLEDPVTKLEDPVTQLEDPKPQPRPLHFPHHVQTFFAPAPPRRPAPRDTSLITQHSAALVHIQSKAKKNHPR